MENPVVVITGASRGIGKATARAFLERGARVVLASKDKDRLEKTRKEFDTKFPNQCVAVQADVRNWGEVQRLLKRANEQFGRIDVLVNNAGVAYAGEFEHATQAEIDEIIDVNVKGVIYGTHAVLPSMRAQRSGIIVNVSSGAGKQGIPGIAVYSASKFAVTGFTEALAGEVGEHGIHVYAVCPGAVATDMQRQVSGAVVGMPPERIANAILSLAGPRPPIRDGECLELYS